MNEPPQPPAGPEPRHEPVMLDEVLDLLAVRPGGLWVDGTVGLGGHAQALLTASTPNGRLIACDRDQEALAVARQRLAPFGDRVRLAHSDFRALSDLIGRERPDGILLDLGVSSLQLDAPERGFSFRSDGPLDMRMDRSQPGTAGEALSRLSEPVLADILHQFGEEPRARPIARAIVAARRRRQLNSTAALAAVVRQSAGHTRPGLDPATRTFQALRIHVNRELEGLGAAVAELACTLAPRGRLAVISFHSLEDREIKQCFRSLDPGAFAVLTRKPLRPGEDECRRNPRARSARLRAVERLAEAA